MQYFSSQQIHKSTQTLQKYPKKFSQNKTAPQKNPHVKPVHKNSTSTHEFPTTTKVKAQHLKKIVEEIKNTKGLELEYKNELAKSEKYWKGQESF